MFNSAVHRHLTSAVIQFRWLVGKTRPICRTRTQHQGEKLARYWTC